MDQGEPKLSDLMDSTDCLEAVGVFKGWKNFSFVVVLLCLLCQQVCFWLVDSGYAKQAEQAGGAVTQSAEPNQPEPVGEALAAEPNEVAESVMQETEKRLINVTFADIAWALRLVNFVLIPAAAFHCLMLLFIVKISMLGRLGGINHIARAFFLSVLVFVLVAPWQKCFPGVCAGVIYTPEELFTFFQTVTVSECPITEKMLYYLRFCIYWVFVVLLLVFSQIRSMRWSRTILRRLEVI